MIMDEQNIGSLSVIPTPIGNLEDVTLRALRLLQTCDILLCEDTRSTAKLLRLLELPARPMLSLNARNEKRRVAECIERLESGDQLALLSDAGTPGVSDPGLSLIAAAIEAKFDVDVLPGPTALIPALLMSGLRAQPFHFEGFLPQKKGRQKRLATLSSNPTTMIFYESPYRVLRLFSELVEHFGAGREAALVREISKMHQEVLRGSVAEIAEILTDRGSVKGECVVVVAGCD